MAHQGWAWAANISMLSAIQSIPAQRRCHSTADDASALLSYQHSLRMHLLQAIAVYQK